MNDYGECPICHTKLSAKYFIDEEYKVDHGAMYKTGRKRHAVDYLFCKNCGHKECVDDTFDGKWY